MTTEPKRLSREDFVGTEGSFGAAPRARDTDVDLSPEEAAEVERQREARASLLARGRDLAARLADPNVVTTREAEQRRREASWRSKARARARERNAPLDDDDVAKYALEPRPAAGQAMDAVREFLAWRDAQSERGRYKGIFVVLSEPGGGKSSAGAWAVVWHRDSALYLTAAEVSSSPRTAFTDTHAAWRAMVAPDLVVVDEIGMDRDPSTVLALALERYNRGRATVLLGNLTPDAFFARYPDPRLQSRLQHQASRGGPTLIELTTGDLRTREQ